MITAAEQGTIQILPTASVTQADRHVADKQSERRMLSKAQVAARLGCSERSLERLVKQGRFPASRRYGRTAIWFEAAVEHVLGLAEQEQLQWLPTAMSPAEMFAPAAAQPVEPMVSSLIPEAHELEPEAPTRTARKSHKAAGTTQRRALTGASAEDIEALSRVLHLPTV